MGALSAGEVITVIPTRYIFGRLKNLLKPYNKKLAVMSSNTGYGCLNSTGWVWSAVKQFNYFRHTKLHA